MIFYPQIFVLMMMGVAYTSIIHVNYLLTNDNSGEIVKLVSHSIF